MAGTRNAAGIARSLLIGLAFVLVGGIGGSLWMGVRAKDSVVASTVAQAGTIADNSLTLVFHPADLSGPAGDDRAAALHNQVTASVLDTSPFTTVTLWSQDGRILFSTDVGRIGTSLPGQKDRIKAAIVGTPQTQDIDGSFSVMAPFHLPSGVGDPAAVELTRSDDAIAAAPKPWRTNAIFLGFVLLIVGFLLVRVQRIGDVLATNRSFSKQAAATPPVLPIAQPRSLDPPTQGIREEAEARRRAEDRARAAEDRLSVLQEQYRKTLEELHATQLVTRDAPQAFRSDPKLEQRALKAEGRARTLEGQVLALQSERDKIMKELLELSAEAAPVADEAELDRLRQAEQETIGLRAELEGAQTQLVTLRRELDEVRARSERAAELQEDLDAAHVDALHSREASESAQAELRAAQTELDDARTELRALRNEEQRAAMLDDELRAARAELESQTVAHGAELERLTVAHGAELERLTVAHGVELEGLTTTYRAELEAETASLREQLADGESELQTRVQAARQEFQSQLDSIEASYRDQLGAREADLADRIVAAERQARAAAGELEGAKASARAAREEAAAVSEQLTAETERLAATASELEALKGELADRKQRFDAAGGEAEQVREEMERALEEAEQARGEVATLGAKLLRANEELATARDQFAGQQARADELSTALADADREAKGATSQARTLASQLEAAAQENADLNRRLQELEARRALEVAGSQGRADLDEILKVTQERLAGQTEKLISAEDRVHELEREAAAAAERVEEVEAELRQHHMAEAMRQLRGEGHEQPSESSVPEGLPVEDRRAASPFLNELSHDAKKALSQILGVTQILKHQRDAKEQAQLIRQLTSHARRLDHTVSDLVDADRLAHGTVELTVKRTDLQALVERVVEESGVKTDHEVRVEADALVVGVDQRRTEQILAGLLRASGDRTPKGKTITVKLSHVDGGVMIFVEDPGPATDGALSPVVRRFAEVQGGWARVEARDDGGSSFRVYLPDGGPNGPTPRPERGAEGVGGDLQIVVEEPWDPAAEHILVQELHRLSAED